MSKMVTPPTNPITKARKIEVYIETDDAIICVKEAGISEFVYGSCCEPYYYKDELIMIDACTAATNVVNVLVLEDGLLE